MSQSAGVARLTRGERRLSQNMEIEAPALRRRPALGDAFRSDRFLLAIAQTMCVLIVGGWVGFLAYLTLILI